MTKDEQEKSRRPRSHGRPVLDPALKRSKLFTVRLTKAEYEQIADEAAGSRMTINGFVVARLTDRTVFTRTDWSNFADFKEAAEGVARAGSALKEISESQGGCLTFEQRREAVALFNALRRSYGAMCRGLLAMVESGCRRRRFDHKAIADLVTEC